MSVKIIGTGSYIPSQIIPNENFLNHNFKNADGSSIDNDNETIIEKFEAITGIRERRYASSNLNASDIGFLAAQKAIEDAEIDKESLDYIIVAHNFNCYFFTINVSYFWSNGWKIYCKFFLHIY